MALSKAEVVAVSGDYKLCENKEQNTKEGRNLLRLHHTVIAKNFELAYLSSSSNRTASGKVWTLAHDARSDQLRSNEMIQTLGVTADHILKRMLPNLRTGIEKKKPNLIKAAVDTTLKRIKVMQDAANDTQTRYETFQKEMVRVGGELDSLMDKSTEESNTLTAKIAGALVNLHQLELNLTEWERKQIQMLSDMEKLQNSNVRQLEHIETEGKTNIKSAKYPGWLDALCGVGIVAGAVFAGPAVLFGGIGASVLGVKSVVNPFIVSKQIDSHTKRMIEFQSHTNALEQNKRLEIEKANDIVCKNRTEAATLKAEIKKMEQDMASSDARKQIVATVDQVKKLDACFMTNRVFWSNMNSRYEAIQICLEDNLVTLEMDDDVIDLALDAIKDAEMEWKLLSEFCHKYEEECLGAVTEDYRFLSDNLGSMSSEAIEERKILVRTTIEEKEKLLNVSN